MNILRPKSSNAASMGIPRSEPAQLPNTKTEHSQDSKAVTTKASSLGSSSRSDKAVSQETYRTSQIDETRRFLIQATKEMVNLMNKDYGGMARRNPPHHNYEPWH
ncbi:hypothetical protein CJ030_MR6G021401 [Morella rubra]|uniref:Uncharacterized protein n=1 Tax=Morella rubra TaxID=262757 RepID=A0A6A1VEV8_9ROSI|nr:hypothetical protein CJ030_MR6G021401 [Morella rubra]